MNKWVWVVVLVLSLSAAWPHPAEAGSRCDKIAVVPTRNGGDTRLVADGVAEGLVKLRYRVVDPEAVALIAKIRGARGQQVQQAVAVRLQDVCMFLVISRVQVRTSRVSTRVRIPVKQEREFRIGNRVIRRTFTTYVWVQPALRTITVTATFALFDRVGEPRGTTTLSKGINYIDVRIRSRAVNIDASNPTPRELAIHAAARQMIIGSLPPAPQDTI